MRVELNILGPGTLLVGGQRRRVHSAKALALLSYLALEADRPHSRDKLAGLLWGNADEKAARQSVRQCLYSLREATGGILDDCLDLSPDRVTFRPSEVVTIDARELRRLSSSTLASDWERAVSLYRAPLLDGVVLDDCDEFDDWLLLHREHLGRLVVGTLDKLISTLIASRDWERARAFADNLIALDPIREDSHCRLFAILHGLGDRDALRRAYTNLCVRLQKELGSDPTRETQERHADLLAPTDENVVDHVHSDLPLIGREREIAQLREQVHRLERGEGGLFAVTGETGIGKSHVIRELTRWTAGRFSRRIRILRGQCYEADASVPYATCAELLMQLTGSEWSRAIDSLQPVWQSELARLVPSLAPKAERIAHLPHDEDRLRLRQAMLHLLRALATDGPIMVIVEDLHWADEESLGVLAYAVRHLAGVRALLLVSWRRDAPLSNRALAALLQSTGAGRQLVLAPLAWPDIMALAQQVSRGTNEGASESAARWSEGNPFVLLEVLRAKSIQSRPTPPLSPHDDDGGGLVPWRVQELIRGRVEALSEGGSRLLRALSIARRPTPLALYASVIDLTESQLLDYARHLTAHGFVQEINTSSSHPSLHFTHDYLRAAVNRDIPAYERQMLHRRLGEVLMTWDKTPRGTATEEVAWHFERADDPRAVAALTKAAHASAGIYAYSHAADFYARALARISDHERSSREQRFDLLQRRESMLCRLGRRTEQRHAIDHMVAEATALDDERKLATAFIRQAGLMAYLSQHGDARNAGERALDLYRSVGDKAGEAQALRELGFIHWSAGDFSAALDYCRTALALHRILGDSGGEASALHNLAEIHRSLGSPRQALGVYDEALQLHWSVRNRQGQVLTLFGMAHALHAIDDDGAAERRYREVLALSEQIGDRLMASRAHQAIAVLAHERKALDVALDAITRAADMSREMGYGQGLAHDLLEIARVQATRGESPAAATALREALGWFSLTEDHEAHASTARQLAALESGDIEGFSRSGRPAWIKSHVDLPEGKVYCEFESPLARQQDRA